MSYRIKVPAKTLSVDEAHLSTWVDHTLHGSRDYLRPVLVGLGVVVLAATVVGGVFYVDRQATQKAQDLEQEAMRFLTAPSANDPQKADHALKEAIARYRQIVDQYPRTATAPLALYHLGNTLVQANEFSAAIDAYQRFLSLYSSNPSMAGLVQQRLAYVYLHKGDRDQAVKAFTGILETPGTLNRDQALFELARLEESQSRPEGALARYQELIKTYPNSPFTSEATIRTKIMETKKAQESTPPVPSTPPASVSPQKSPQAPSSSASKKKS
ncbi:MAG: outer membrane protein assembly factor BamD [Nitrospiraceae bacterium]|nr:MAG: outer membrane protein assembly factor BamD [Nitrospiraceae bacterium]